MIKPTLSKRVGSVIAKHRKSDGLTQAVLAELMQIEKETLSRIETGKISPSLERIEQIANLLHRPTYDFFHEPMANDLEQSIFELFKNMSHEQKTYAHNIMREVVKLINLN